MDTWARVHFFILSLCYLFHCSLATNQPQNQLPSAVVVGTVYCDACFQKEFSKPSHLIPGASVAVECENAASKLSFQKEVKTDSRGVFRVRLPLEISKEIKLIEYCSAKLIRSNVPFCSIASSATPAGLRLKSTRNGIHVFSAGFFTFRPSRQPELCSQKNVGNQKLDHSAFSAQPSQLPPGGRLPLPPNPFFPLPPFGGGLPFPPNPFFPLPPFGGGLPFQTNTFFPFPPNLPFPPNPFFPLPPNLPFPPNPFLQPPLSPQPSPSLPPPPAPQPSPAPN